MSNKNPKATPAQQRQLRAYGQFLRGLIAMHRLTRIGEQDSVKGKYLRDTLARALGSLEPWQKEHAKDFSRRLMVMDLSSSDQLISEEIVRAQRR